MNNQPGQHPLYQLGQPGAIQLNMDNIFAAAAEQNAGVHKPAATIITPQYAYPTAAEMHLQHHTAPALNLSQPHILVQQSEPAHQTVIAYPEAQHQQQPISFKTTVASAAPASTQATVVAGTAQPVRAEAAQEQPPQDKKKDIVAEAASKIFEDDGGAGAAGKKPATTAADATPTTSSGATASDSATTTGPPITAIKSEPGTSAATTSPTPTKATDTKPTPRPVQSRGRGRGRGGYSSSQVTPRLSLLDDEDDGLTCRMCLQSFWYKTHLLEHLKDAHSISEPDRYEREERERRLRRIREVQQRRMVAQRQFMRGGRGGRGRGRPPVMQRPAGPRPSFQYRDGAFICDLCKKSFSDGNDMVTHWKSHVKQQRLAGPPPGHRRGRPGRPPSSYYSSRGRPVSGRGGRGLGRADKGKPRWTAYLVWSTKRRRDITHANPDLTFAEVAKKISEEWKLVTPDDREDLQEKAEDMNFRGVRKARPREVESESSETDWTSDEDPDFEDKLVKIKFKKEIKREIKREKLEYGDDGYGVEGLDDEDILDDDDDEISSDDASEMPSVPRKSRSARQRKRPSFFQEFEDEENNLDKILEDYELEQIEEAKKPKEEKPKPKPKDPNAPPRRRRRKRTPEPEEMPEEVELETSRSGRIRKKTKFMDYFEPEEGEVQGVDASDNDDEEDGEFKPGSDVEELEKEDDKVSSTGSEAETEDDSIDDIDDMHEFNRPPKEGTSGLSITKIPIKKKKRKKKRALMTDAEIEAATKAAMEKGGEGQEDGSGSEYTTDDSEEGETNNKDEAKGEKSKDGGVVVAKKSAPPPPTEDGDADSAAAKDKDKEAPSSTGAEDAQSNEGSQGEKAAAESEAAPTAAEPDAAAASENNPLQDEERAAAAASEENPLGDMADEGEGGDGEATNPLDDADKEDESSSANPLGDIPDAEDPMDTSEPAAPAAAVASEKDGDKSGDGAVSEETPAAAETEEDLLTSAASSKMEEGDDKFKDIIAEGQIDNIFN